MRQPAAHAAPVAGTEVKDQGVVIARPEGRIRVGLAIAWSIGVATSKCDSPHPRRRGAVGEDVVEGLGGTSENE